MQVIVAVDGAREIVHPGEQDNHIGFEMDEAMDDHRDVIVAGVARFACAIDLDVDPGRRVPLQLLLHDAIERLCVINVQTFRGAPADDEDAEFVFRLGDS